jgi:dihydroxy-acid dehydratase
MSPCNTTLREQAQHAKTGIYAAGGTPHECPVVSVSDGLTVAHSGMRFSLISRELIADSVEATVRGHKWDGIFGIGGCDKNMPGIVMGMARCNVPSMFLYGGSALPGSLNGRDLLDNTWLPMAHSSRLPASSGWSIVAPCGYSRARNSAWRPSDRSPTSPAT